MNSLHIPGTVSTAEVEYNEITATLSMTGVSIPENADQFFRPLHDWTDMFVKVHTGKVNVRIFLTYFNTSTIRHFLPFMQRLIHHFRENMEVKWQYEESDEELLERGEELSDVLQFPFVYEALPDQD
jgi:hypothetical protein